MIKNISKYNHKLVQIESYDHIFEGYAEYDNVDFNEAEYGRAEESLQILCIKFYKSDISNIKEIDDYTSENSDLEPEIIDDYDLVEEAIEIGEDIEVERIKKYFYKSIDKDHMLEEEIKIKELLDRSDIMAKKCNCGPDCKCGCQEGKECTCKDEKCKCGCGDDCKCDENCDCGCHDKKESKCNCNK